MGSAAVNMCMVAAGRADAYVEFGLHCWDIAAGDLIVREAGGVVSSPDGKEILCLIYYIRRVFDCNAESMPLFIYQNLVYSFSFFPLK